MINSNTPVFADIPNLAKKFHVQDISIRAFAGRITKVTGIKVSPTIMAELLGHDDYDELSRTAKSFDAKLEKWQIKMVGEQVINDLASAARPFMFKILTAYLVGFIPAEVLTREFKPTKKMLDETGGVASTRWDIVLEDIAKFQESKSKKKVGKKKSGAATSKAKVKELPPNAIVTGPVVIKDILDQIAKSANTVWGYVTDNGPTRLKLATSKPFTKPQIRALMRDLVKTELFSKQGEGFRVSTAKEFSIDLEWQGRKTQGTVWLVSINQDGVVDLGQDL